MLVSLETRAIQHRSSTFLPPNNSNSNNNNTNAKVNTKISPKVNQNSTTKERQTQLLVSNNYAQFHQQEASQFEKRQASHLLPSATKAPAAFARRSLNSSSISNLDLNSNSNHNPNSDSIPLPTTRGTLANPVQAQRVEPLKNTSSATIVKTPSSSFALFSQEFRPLIEQQNPPCDHQTAGKILTQWWHNLDQSERNKYKTIASSGRPDEHLIKSQDWRWCPETRTPFTTQKRSSQNKSTNINSTYSRRLPSGHDFNSPPVVPLSAPPKFASASSTGASPAATTSSSSNNNSPENSRVPSQRFFGPNFDLSAAVVASRDPRNSRSYQLSPQSEPPDSAHLDMATVRPISPQYQHALDSAISLAKELASRNMADSGESSPKTPNSPDKKRFNFKLKHFSKSFSEASANIRDIESSISYEAKQAYKSLVDRGPHNSYRGHHTIGAHHTHMSGHQHQYANDDVDDFSHGFSRSAKLHKHVSSSTFSVKKSLF